MGKEAIRPPEGRSETGTRESDKRQNQSEGVATECTGTGGTGLDRMCLENVICTN